MLHKLVCWLFCYFAFEGSITMSNEGKIAELLLARVEAIEGIDKAFPNVVYEPTGADYLDIAHVPNGSAQEGLSTAYTYQGILQLTLVQQGAIGAVKPQDKAGNIAESFAKGTKLYGDGIKVFIPIRPVVSGSREQDDEIRTPITIEYYAS